MRKWILCMFALIISFCIAIVKWKYDSNEGIQIYQVVLEEYDRVQHDEDYAMEKWKYVIGETAGYVYREKELGYCFSDFNDDNIPELIIGFKEEMRDKYRPYVVYICIDGEIKMGIENGRYEMDIYKNGIVRLWGGYSGYDFYMYYNLSDPMQLRNLGQLTVEEREEKNFFYSDGKKNELEITEEEFYSQRDSLEDVEAELDWKRLDGFWNEK